jgi:hypothetical protein
MPASAALAVDVVIFPHPFASDQYLGKFDASFSEAGLFIPTWDFVSPVDGSLSFTLRATGAVQFIGYQFDHGPVTSFTTFTGNDPLVTGIPVGAGPHSLLVGYQAAPQFPPHTPATGGFMGLIVIQASPIPEPQTWALLAAGLLALGWWRPPTVTPRRASARGAPPAADARPAPCAPA